ncbi:hypothetical protein G5C51_33435 [Streptomyces sp. A7024]|uniref:Lipoprotein n=1 Tax=Streptomyces coryli TaxID=1128680 RepID=A0A6G4U9V1_9ACTN|nr:hypothetical protein [Streptomyces coryli]NGN68782.1 hypothetical protein [Streptomyces coryli]
MPKFPLAPRSGSVLAAAAACVVGLSACTGESAGGDAGQRGNGLFQGPEASRSNEAAEPSRSAADTTACGGEPTGNGTPTQKPSRPSDPSDRFSGVLGVSFDDWESKDKAEQAVLDAAAEAERHTYRLAGEYQEEETGGYPYRRLFAKYYDKGSQAYTCRKAYAEKFYAGPLRLDGTARFYDPHATVAADGTHATVRYCADLSVFQASKGGKRYALAEPGTFTRHSTELRKVGGGAWKTVKERAEPGGCGKDGLP